MPHKIEQPISVRALSVKSKEKTVSLAQGQQAKNEVIKGGE